MDNIHEELVKQAAQARDDRTQKLNEIFAEQYKIGVNVDEISVDDGDPGTMLSDILGMKYE